MWPPMTESDSKIYWQTRFRCWFWTSRTTLKASLTVSGLHPCARSHRWRKKELFWRIKKRDLGLPKPRVTKIAVRLGEVQAAIYQALAFKVLKDYENAPEE